MTKLQRLLPAGRDLVAFASRFGLVGGMLSWFAVGCPVCNKLALIALGYAGAITWFAPMQPFLAVLALVLSGVALLWRLRGEVVCVVPGRVASRASAAREERAEVR